MRYQTFPPHPRLAPFLMHVLALELDACESHLPAHLSPVLLLFLRGGVTRIEPDSTLVRHPRFTLLGPMVGVRRSMVDPGTVFISMCFRPGLLQDTLKIEPGDIYNSHLTLHDIIDPARVDRLLDDLDHEPRIDECVMLFQQFLLESLDLTRKPSLGARFIAARHKMFEPLIDLALHFGIGERQLERQVRKAFGVPLRDVRRMSRFGYALPKVLHRVVAWGDLTHIAQEAGYYDQAHMHREFIDLAGVSPVTLLKKVGDRDPGFWAYSVSPEDYKNLYLPAD